ncbi:MAG: LTA synthase family protein [Firmicutes bacterium]|nr:LTA synthase family protein [Bacillota bacterium]
MLAALGICFVFFTVIFLYCELVFRYFSGIGIEGFLLSLLLNLPIIAVITLILFIAPKQTVFFITELSMIFISLLYSSQLIYNRIFHEFYSIDKIVTGLSAIYQFHEIMFNTMAENYVAILLLLLPIAIAVILLKTHFPFLNTGKYCISVLHTSLSNRYIGFSIILLLLCHFLLLLPVVLDPYSQQAIQYGQGEESRVSSVREVSLVITMEIDLLSHFIEAKNLPLVHQLPPASVVDEPLKATEPPFEEDDYSRDLAMIPPWLGKVNGLDIDFQALVERDIKNSKLLQLHEYFRFLEPSEQNEHTGIFKGYNLITICAEAFSSYVIDPQRTPILYMMQNEGINFLNFYSIYGAGTIGGELSLITGLMPRGGEAWCREAAKVYLPFSFASQFNRLGVQPIAYHSGSYTYYDRHRMFPALGYIYKARDHGLAINNPDWHVSDQEMIELSINDYINDELFYVHYMTLSGHSPYSFGGNPLSKKNQEAVKDLPYSIKIKAYLACQIELEHALKYLLEQLEEAGIAERTLIVLATDHYPYGLTKEDISELAGHTVDPAFELYKSSCIMYVKGMAKEVVKAPSFVPDIAPTVSNLLGFDFDSRFFTGRDVFSTAPALVFLDTGFITEVGVYDKNRGSFIPYEDVDAPKEYRESIQSIIDAKKSALMQMIKLDYFTQIKEYLVF